MQVAKQILFPTFRFLARHRMPRLAAALLALTSRRITKFGRHAGQSKQRYRVLALSLNKSGFLQDIQETFLSTDDFEVIRWPFYALRAFSDAILSPDLNNKRYLTDDPSTEATKDEYRDFLAKVWKYFCAIRKTDLVISPNYGYYVQREFAAALEAAGTPFVVLHKENLKSSGRVEYWESVYKAWRGKFSGRKILVYNETERALQASSGVTTAGKITVTGMPRLDRVHHWRTAQAGQLVRRPRPQVLFFAFDKQDKLPTSRTKRAGAQIDNRWGTLSWGLLCENTHHAIADLARNRPGIDVIVKIKAASRHQSEVVKMLEAGGCPLPSNLKLVSGGDAFELLKISDVVVGFNSTAQLEALAAGLPVISPCFNEALLADTSEFAIDLGDAVEYARAPSEIIDLVCSHIDNPRELPIELSPAIRHTLIQWTGNDDGKACRHVLDAIYKELD